MIYRCKQCGEPVEKRPGKTRTKPPSRCDQCRGIKDRHRWGSEELKAAKRRAKARKGAMVGNQFYPAKGDGDEDKKLG